MEEEKLEKIQVKEILLRGNYVTDADLERAERYAKERHASITEYLLLEGLLTKDLLGQAIAEAFNVPYADLNSYQPLREQVLRISEDLAKKFRIVLFREDETSITIATDNPTQADLGSALQKSFPDKKIEIAYSLSEDIEAVFIHYKKALETRFAEIVKAQKRIAPEIVEQIFDDALAFRASDIHFEPQDKEAVIRFRIDGILHEAGRLSREYYGNILNRIKVMGRMRLDEHFAAQDGAIRFAKDGQAIDMRVSIAPLLDGEKVVIRLLAEYVRSFTFADLGLSPADSQKILVFTRKPFGMIIVSGPTGSGKTTTLYSLVKVLNRPEINITTIEDPVEYKIPGVNQIQINPLSNLTYAKGLKSIARQDPDIILVGEVRDKETAEIAVNAALTGHLLFSTFHANDAATSIPRLLDMGVEPFLLASTLELLISQRLVRRICESCRVSVPDQVTSYKGKGCAACNHTGHRGRIAIFEFITITPEMQDLILRRPTIKQIWELARSQGARSMYEDGLEKVKNGITTMAELLRVASPPK